MAPAVIDQPSGDRIHLVLGGSGGSRIFPAMVQAILNVDWGMDVSAAVEAPRVHDQLFPVVTDVETGFDAGELADLVERGHGISSEWLRAIKRSLIVYDADGILSVRYQSCDGHGTSHPCDAKRNNIR